LAILEEATQRAGYDLITVYIGRLLCHFPYRDATKDAIVISDVARLCHQDRVSALAVAEIVDEYIRDDKAKAQPLSGQIIKKINLRTMMYKNMADRILGVDIVD